MVNAVGGSTVHYAGLSARFHPWNFRSRSETIERYGAGAIPEGSTVADWPFDYTELEPYYDQAERAIGVAGAAGRVGAESLPGGSQFEGPRSRGYPLDPLRRTGWTELMATAAQGLGWHPFPAPAAINSAPYNGNPECTYCGFCASNGCYRNAKGSVDATVIQRAEATGLLRIETGARVVRIEVDAEGLVRGVTFVQDGRERFQPARVVLVGTFTYENTRLLLLSTSKAYPNGLSNNHGQVGQHYMAHITPDVFGLFPGRRLNVYSGLWTQATCVDDWNADNFDHSGLGFIGGALLSAPHELKPIGSAVRSAPPWVPRWGVAVESVADGARTVVRLGQRPDGGSLLRGQPARSRSGGQGSLRPAGRSGHPSGPGERGARLRLPEREARSLASRGRRDARPGRSPSPSKPGTARAEHAWETTPTARSSIAGGSRTRLRTWECSAPRPSRRRAVTIRRSPSRRSHGERRSTSWTTGRRSRPDPASS